MSPFGFWENISGGGALFATAVSDVLLENTGLTQNGVAVGKDTLVSARNALAGIIPEANVDALVSNSQFKYDLDRILGNKSAGSIALSDIKNLFIQFITNDWW